MASPWWCKALTRRVSTYRRTPTRTARQRGFRPFVELLEDRRLLAVITVTTLADDLDTSSTDGQVSLREAIESMNAGSNVNGDVSATDYGTDDKIIFRIDVGGGNVAQIDLKAALDAITVGGLKIDGDDAFDGSTQLKVVLNGSGAGDANGLMLHSSDNTIAGLVIQEFSGHGIFIDGVANSGADRNVVVSNFIGTDVDGLSDVGNGGDGIFIQWSDGNTIQGNVISGNTGNGVHLDDLGPFNFHVAYNLIADNRIGVSADGKGALGNDGNGILIEGRHGGFSADHNTITGNVISANAENGILLEGAEIHDNLITSNLIGTDVTGTKDKDGDSLSFGNGQHGIYLLANDFGSMDANSIGGTSTYSDGKLTGDGNLISNNKGDGIRIEIDGSDASAYDNFIRGNFIGTDITGTKKLGNNWDGAGNGGVALIHVGFTEVGGTLAQPNDAGNEFDGNLISANFGAGVYIEGNGDSDGPAGNEIIGNLIGTAINGGATAGGIGNTKHGVHIVDGAGHAIGNGPLVAGGPIDPSGNVISENDGDGVRIEGGNSFDNAVQGNFIGTDISGTLARGNVGAGVLISDASSNVIGGFVPDGETESTGSGGNLISANGTGVVITGSAAAQNIVAGNFIGTDINGTSALGNLSFGVIITDGASSNSIGGVFDNPFNEGTVGGGNLISGNALDGVVINSTNGNPTTSNVVQGNFIGTDVSGTQKLGNGGHGVVLYNTNGSFYSGPAGNLIGGSDSPPPASLDLRDFGEGNIISGNAASGVYIDGDDSDLGNGDPSLGSIGNEVQGNYIGTDASGKLDLGNGDAGVFLGAFAQGNVIGGNSPPNSSGGEGNVISGNLIGVAIDWDSTAGTSPTSNTVTKNFIGTNAAGTGPLGNEVGVRFLGDDAAIDDTSAVGEGKNLIAANDVAVEVAGAGNTLTRLRIGDDDAGSPLVSALENGVGLLISGDGNFIGDATPGPSAYTLENVFYNNYSHGVWITGDQNVLHNNFIGINSDLDSSIEVDVGKGNTELIANGGAGVLIEGANNTVGGTSAPAYTEDESDTPGQGNLISNNLGYGVVVKGAGATGNVIAGNYIGTNIDGDAARGNTAGGVLIADAASNSVGFALDDDDNLIGIRNLISGNGGDGVRITGSSSTANLVAGNYIGTDASGVNALGNAGHGVQVANGAHGNFIGQGEASTQNLLFNGSFELPDLPDTTDIAYYLAAIPGWTRVAGEAIEIQVGTVEGSSPSDGNQWLELNGLDHTTIAQLVATTAGATYELSFDIGVRFPSGVSTMEVWFDGELVDTIVVDEADHSDFEWLPQSYLVTASGSSAVLMFKAIGSDPGLGNLLDNVKLVGTANFGRNVISGNGGDGVLLSGADANLVQGNFIGIDATGAAGLANTGAGVTIVNGADNSIGGTIAYDGDGKLTDAGNVISANGGPGVHVFGSGSVDNVIQGNFIGTDVTGTQDLGNGSYGVNITQATGNLVGGSSTLDGDGRLAGLGNLVSNNNYAGVFVSSAGSNSVQGNFIGTDITGTQGLGNNGSGVELTSTDNVLVGGVTADLGNLISGNTGSGVYVSGELTPPEEGATIQFNIIGLDVTGLAALGNGYHGVQISNSDTNLVYNNTISGNSSYGLYIDGTSAANNVFRNIIGLGTDGTTASYTVDENGPVEYSLGNSTGIGIFGNANFNFIGGIDAGNVISNNANYGVEIANGATNNRVDGNIIGLDQDAAVARGNGADGVAIQDASGNFIGKRFGGDLVFGAGNIISGNGGNGVYIDGYFCGATANLVAGNLIGTNADGAVLGNAQNGVHIVQADGNTVGGALADLGNVIQWNHVGGVWLRVASDNTVQGNTISYNGGITKIIKSYKVTMPELATPYVGFTGSTGPLGSDDASTQYVSDFTLDGHPVTTYAGENSLNGGLFVYSNGAFDLTTYYASGNQANSIFTTLAALDSFSLSFDIDIYSPYAGGKGFTVAVVGDPTALGLAGDGLGYAGILDSLALAFTHGVGSVSTMGLYLNGDLGSPVTSVIDLSEFGIDLSNGLFHFDISYDGSALTVSIVEKTYSEGYGVLISNGYGEGAGPADRNLIDANTITDNYGDGVRIENNDYYSSGPTANLVTGNTISGNEGDGVEIFDSEYNYVQDGNQITDNAGSGVLIEGYYGYARGNEVTGNTIARNFEGVTIYADENIIGQVDAGNTISDNYGDGVYIAGDFNVAQANTITGNGGDGVALGSSATSNLIGGSTADGAGNSISGNSGNGVIIGDGEITCSDTANLVQGNLIRSNGLNGVLIRNGQSYNLIGQFSDLDPDGVYRNIINSNALAGVAVAGYRWGYVYHDDEENEQFYGEWVLQFSSHNAIVGNLIYSNGTLPIDLYEVTIEETRKVSDDSDADGASGPTANDSGDPDEGPNELQNYPTLTNPVVSGNNVTWTVNFDSSPNPDGFYFEFFGYTSSGVVFLGGTYELPTTFTLNKATHANVTSVGVTATRLAFYDGKGQGGKEPARVAAQSELQVGSTSEMFITTVPTTTTTEDPPPDVNIINTLTEESAAQRVVPLAVIVPPQDAAAQASLNSLSLRNAAELLQLTQFFSKEPLADSPGEIHGQLFDDINALGQKADGTLPLAGYQVFLDINGNGELDEGEPITATNENGEYSFTGLRPGQYVVLPVLGRNDDQTFGTREDNRVELRSGAMIINNMDFGIRIRGRRTAPRRSGSMLPGTEPAALLVSADELARYWSARAADTVLAAPAPALAPPAELTTASPEEAAPAPSWWQWLTLGAGVVIGPWFHLFRKRGERRQNVG